MALWEYQSFASQEYPDVLAFKDSDSTLYEIKMSRSDFLNDQKKEVRQKWKPKTSWWGRRGNYRQEAVLQAERPELFYVQFPHLGAHRYYVCLEGVIKVDELPEGWGLYYYKSGKMYKKRESKKFRRDLFQENAILAHALRAYVNGVTKRVVVRKYEKKLY